MKMIVLVVAIFLMSFSCDSQNPIYEVKQIEFQTGGMSGYHETVAITADSIRLTYEERRTEGSLHSYTTAIEKGAWENLMKTLQAVPISSIDTLESPTMARAYDGAAHSEIRIYTSNGESYAHSFDDENPHSSLTPLMQAIRTLASTAEKGE